MVTPEQIAIKEAAIVIERAIRVVGGTCPVQVIDHGRAIRIGTYNENLTVRLQDGLWRVSEYTPYLQRMMAYPSLEACAHDIALCEPGVLFHEITATEREIDAAVEQAEAALHPVG
jgi:poly-beta-hydroxyalkanoate depolymerase